MSIPSMSDSKDRVVAKPSGMCCLKGFLHQGEPRGSYEDIADIPSYVSKPNSSRSNGHILLYFPDVFGFFPNGMLIMDAFAEAGYLVVGLDYFRGDPVWKRTKDPFRPAMSPDFDYEAWKSKHTAFANENVPKWIQQVKSQFGKVDTKYCCVGYCFGAPYVCDELARDTVTAGAFAHPAFLKEHHFSNLKKPLFLSCSEIDHTFDTEGRRRAMDVLQREGKTYHLQLFSKVEHGFALRGNMDDPYERWVKEQSLQGIIAWFDYWLGQ